MTTTRRKTTAEMTGFCGFIPILQLVGFLLMIVGSVAFFMFGIFDLIVYSGDHQDPTVQVVSLSVSTSTTGTATMGLGSSSTDTLSGNWSVALWVKNENLRFPLRLDHAQVLLLYKHSNEFIAGTFLKRFTVAAQEGIALETGVMDFSRKVWNQTASWIMAGMHLWEFKVQFNYCEGTSFLPAGSCFDCDMVGFRPNEGKVQQGVHLLSGSTEVLSQCQSL